MFEDFELSGLFQDLKAETIGSTCHCRVVVYNIHVCINTEPNRKDIRNVSFFAIRLLSKDCMIISN